MSIRDLVHSSLQSLKTPEEINALSRRSRGRRARLGSSRQASAGRAAAVADDALGGECAARAAGLAPEQLLDRAARHRAPPGGARRSGTAAAPATCASRRSWGVKGARLAAERHAGRAQRGPVRVVGGPERRPCATGAPAEPVRADGRRPATCTPLWLSSLVQDERWPRNSPTDVPRRGHNP